MSSTVIECTVCFNLTSRESWSQAAYNKERYQDQVTVESSQAKFQFDYYVY